MRFVVSLPALLRFGAALSLLCLSPAIAQTPSGQHRSDAQVWISDAILSDMAAELADQAVNPLWRREATIPEDWAYSLPEGVTSRQTSFFVDGGVRLQGRLFLPAGFDSSDRFPAVVVGHGINALAIGIEKYAAAFAARGFVAMSIDYQSYGFSDSGADELFLLEPDRTNDEEPVVAERRRVRIKRTNLNNVEEVKAFRAAVSFLQGEPGVDPERIGVWATSNGGTVLATVLATDARIRAAVIHVNGVTPSRGGARDLSGEALSDAVRRVRTGQGAETGAGFSFKTQVDLWYRTRNRDAAPGPLLDRIPTTTAVLFLPAEKDELIGGNRSALAASAALTARGAPSQVITFPGLTHFQPYSGAGFRAGSTLAADWFVRFLGQKEDVR
ncbi:MAG: prolyl oligopeptidase family serine peptidase [Alphaproteobacteria bacterium]|nr:prolyl oligopeptidase family serine peptidase [Alphaproteobacteria bacterium]